MLRILYQIERKTMENNESNIEPEVEVRSADELINIIADTLAEADGESIEGIANQILSAEVEYIEDSLFNVKWEV
jgi:hypothetical protein